MRSSGVARLSSHSLEKSEVTSRTNSRILPRFVWPNATDTHSDGGTKRAQLCQDATLPSDFKCGPNQCLHAGESAGIRCLSARGRHGQGTPTPFR